MMNGKLGVCVIGCGYMGGIHAERWHALPHAEIVAVVDILEERAKQFATQYHLDEYYSDYHQAVILPEVDVVSVCTPTYLHAEMTIFCAQQGKHVLCEKPVALSLDQAQDMLEAEKEFSIKLGLGFMRRHSTTTEVLREALASGAIQRPVIYHAKDIRQIRPKLAMHDAQQNGGPVIDMAVHLFDFWRYIFQSEPTRVFAQGFCLGFGRPELEPIPNLATDTAIISVSYASGDIGNFVVCWGLPPGVNPAGYPDQIYASNGFAEIELSMQNQSFRWTKEGGASTLLQESNEDMYQREIASMAHSILHADDFSATAEDGKEALQVSMAALEAIKSGKAVYLR